MQLRRIARKVASSLPHRLSATFPKRVQRHGPAPGGTEPPVRDAAWLNAKQYAYAYRRLLAALEGKSPQELGVAHTTAPTLESSLADCERAHALRARTLLFDRLQAGEPLEDAMAATVRDQLKAGKHLLGRSLSQSLQANPSTRVAGNLGSAIVAVKMSLPGLAWASFQQVPAEIWRRTAADEFFKTAFQIDHEIAVSEARRLIVDRPKDVPVRNWLAAAKAAFGAKEERLAKELFDVADRLADDSPKIQQETMVERNWLRPWLEKSFRSGDGEGSSDNVHLAILDYKSPDRGKSSTNIGDYVQTLACIGNIVRHQKLRFRGPDDLVRVIEDLKGRVRPDLRLDTADQDVTLVQVNRDATSYDAIPQRTWVIAFGWYMQSIFGRHDFPLHPHLRPIFISFHCNRPEMLSPEAIEYLRAHGPVGCRDWSTVHLLLSAGIPAFFSGCVTTTLRTVFPEFYERDRTAATDRVGYVDLPTPPGVERIRQATEDVLDSDLASNLRRALSLMESYRRQYSALVTSRLHCYLPARSIGIPVEFKPKNRADPRFAGLLDLSDSDYVTICDGLLAKLDTILTLILAGGDEEEVYRTWRETCSADVDAAKARHASVPPVPPPSFDVGTTCASVRSKQVVLERSASSPRGVEVNVALALDGNLKQEMTVVIEAMAANCSRPLHLWILSRDHGSADHERLAALFPQVSFTWLPCDDIDYGPILGMLRHITVSTMDRLLLPDLLPEIDRILYHDIDALPLGDVAVLYDWDLQGRPLAARSAVAANVVSGFANIGRSATRLSEKPSAAHDLLLRMHARHNYDFTAFNAGVLVLDLSRMRNDGFCRHFIPFVEQYGMNDQEVLNCYAGPNRSVLPPRWNSFPAQEVVTTPEIIHWAGPLKPWKEHYIAYREDWAFYTEKVRQRQSEIS